jgi:prepilin-type N-terminal cleavage/methylation domain-containing protein
MLNNIKTVQKERGFTIVELLIVIVVIGILAAITIVAYGNITTRANANAAKANASNVAKVAEAYNANESSASTGYPSLAQLTAYGGTAGNISRIPTGVTVVSTTLSSTHANGKTIQYVPKGTTGGCVGYWDASLGSPAAAYVYVGNGITGTNSATPTCV